MTQTADLDNGSTVTLDTAPVQGRPATYATPSDIRDYLDSMHRRAALLARTGERGTVYVSASPQIQAAPRWRYSLDRVRRCVRPASVKYYSKLWSPRDPHDRYLNEWEDYADTLTGLVVWTGNQTIGPGVIHEIESARLRNLPILVMTNNRRVPLIDCRIAMAPASQRWCAAQILLPESTKIQRNTLVACITAMGGAA